ncbi:MAG: CsgG/HfaB family protein [Turneriella sp.]
MPLTLYARYAIFVASFFALPTLSAARITVSDFQVQSANPAYKFLGKGFAEFVSIELLKSDAIELIEREKRLDAIREIELSQTGLVDEKAQIEAGKLLTAEYIVLGSIYDINNQLSITVRIIETRSTRVIWQDKVTGKLAQYDSVSAQIAARILTKLNLVVPAAVRAKQESVAEKAEGVPLKFSTAIDAVDRNETDEARKQLDQAKQLDPRNDAIVAYLRKLVVNTAKFRTISNEYFPNTNPASLGLMRQDRFFLSAAVVNLQENVTRLKSVDRNVIEQDIRMNIGYQAPIGKKWGVGFEGIFFHYKDEIQLTNSSSAATGQTNNILTNPDNFGGIGSLSYAPSENVSFGFALAVYQQVKRQQWSTSGTVSGASGDATDIIRGTEFGFSLGMLLKNTAGTVVFDTLVGYSTQSTFLLNPASMTVGSSVRAPIYNENTLTFGLFGKRIFLALKEINEFYQDRNYYNARIIPVLEFWLTNWLSLRGGAEHNYANLSGTIFNNTGWVAGMSLRGIASGWDFDINYTQRNRPSRIVTGEIINEGIVYFTLSKSNNFIGR